MSVWQWWLLAVILSAIGFAQIVVVAALENQARRLFNLWRRTERKVATLMALSDEIRAKVDEVKAGVAAAVADIQALHSKLDSFLEVGDVAGARAALAELSQPMADLAAAVAVPEDPAPAPEPGVN